jgi:hypothetical protein
MKEIILPTEIIEIPLQDIKFLDNEVLYHSDEQIDKIALSLQAFKFDNPLILGLYRDTYYVIAGVAVLKAARKLNLLKAPCIIIQDLTLEQMRAYAIADNNIAKNSGWDENLLSIELGHLDSLGFDLDYIGFDLTDADFAAIEEVNYASKEPPIPTPAHKPEPKHSLELDSVATTPTQLTEPVHNPVPLEIYEPVSKPEPEPEPEPEPIETLPVIQTPVKNKDIDNNEIKSSKTERKKPIEDEWDNHSDRQRLRQEKEEKKEKEEVINCPRCNHSWSQ